MSGPGPYAVQYDPRAAKELSKLDRTVARRIAKVVKTLEDQPRPQGARPLVGYPGLWRVRVGDYRIVYAIKDAELVILAGTSILRARWVQRRRAPTRFATALWSS